MPNAWSRAEQTGETEAQVLSALENGIHPADSLGRIHHLPKPVCPRSSTVCTTGDWSLPPGGSPTRRDQGRIEALTDALAEAPYEALPACELDQLVGLLQPISERLR